LKMALSLNTRWSRVLAVSLALNVVLATAVGTMVARDLWHEYRPRHSPFAIPGPRQLQQALPEQDQAFLQSVLQAHRPLIKARIDATREARAEAAEILRRDTVSDAELDTLLETLRLRESAIAGAVYDMARDVFAGLDAEGRRALADLVQGRPPPDKPNP